MTGGCHFNLHNNHWNTAIPQWFPFGKDGADTSQRFRFALSLISYA